MEDDVEGRESGRVSIRLLERAASTPIKAKLKRLVLESEHRSIENMYGRVDLSAVDFYSTMSSRNQNDIVQFLRRNLIFT